MLQPFSLIDFMIVNIPLLYKLGHNDRIVLFTKTFNTSFYGLVKGLIKNHPSPLPFSVKGSLHPAFTFLLSIIEGTTQKLQKLR